MPKSEKPPYSKEYCLTEIHTFRKMMGQKTFWTNKLYEKAMEGLLFVYTNTEDMTEAINFFFVATTEDYDRRLTNHLIRI